MTPCTPSTACRRSPSPSSTREAALLTRIDRKYVIPDRRARRRADRHPGLRVLEIDGPTLLALRVDLPRHRRPRQLDRLGAPPSARWKVRTRVYADTGECWLEVKTRGRAA